MASISGCKDFFQNFGSESVQQRQNLLGLIDKASLMGARLKPACRQIALSCRSVQRSEAARVISANQASGATCARLAHELHRFVSL